MREDILAEGRSACWHLKHSSMKTRFKTLWFAATLLANQAHASFHFYDIQEVFSNADGSIMFIELFTTSGGQQFLNGHTITFEINATIQNTVNLSQLPSDSANKTFLVGTANLGTLYGVVPDFVIPANFFTAGASNFINFAEGTDRVNLTLLPTDGTSSLNGIISNAGQTQAATSVNAQATPRNFAGATATIPEPGGAVFILLATGFSGLWRRRAIVRTT